MLKSMLDTDRYTVKLGMAFSRFGISPNAWTVISIIPAILGFVTLAYYGDLGASLILFILAGFIDAIDGSVARVTSRVSSLGAFLDGVIDRYVEFLLYIGLYFYLENTSIEFLMPSGFWIGLLIFGALMPTYIRAYADHRKVVTDPAALKKMGGLLERAERLTLIYAGMLLGAAGGTGISPGADNTLLLIYVIAATAILSNLTALQRLWFAVRVGRGG